MFNIYKRTLPGEGIATAWLAGKLASWQAGELRNRMAGLSSTYEKSNRRGNESSNFKFRLKCAQQIGAQDTERVFGGGFMGATGGWLDLHPWPGKSFTLLAACLLFNFKAEAENGNKSIHTSGPERRRGRGAGQREQGAGLRTKMESVKYPWLKRCKRKWSRVWPAWIRGASLPVFLHSGNTHPSIAAANCRASSAAANFNGSIWRLVLAKIDGSPLRRQHKVSELWTGNWGLGTASTPTACLLPSIYLPAAVLTFPRPPGVEAAFFLLLYIEGNI